ncbi:MAG: hypothetical protein HRT89_13265, partial [Lentisphaeria bacterium]|nr:hypothetical protein [Lentisphaeria bacterium]
VTEAPNHFPLGIGPGRYKSGINYLKQMQADIPNENDLKIPADSNAQYQVYLLESGPLSILTLFVFFIFMLVHAWKKEATNEKFLALILVLALAMTGIFSVIFSKGIGIFAGALLALISTKKFSQNEKVLYPLCTLFASLMFFVLFATNKGTYTKRSYQSSYNTWFVKDILHKPVPSVIKKLEIIRFDTLDTPSKRIIIEAESATSIVPHFQIVPANNTSGNRVLEAPNDRGKGVGRAEYEIDVPEDGDYTLFARVWWEDGCSNSLAIEIGDVPKVLLSNELFKKWQQIESVKPVQLKKGKFTLTLYPVEDGIKIDYFGLIPLK